MSESLSAFVAINALCRLPHKIYNSSLLFPFSRMFFVFLSLIIKSSSIKFKEHSLSVTNLLIKIRFFFRKGTTNTFLSPDSFQHLTSYVSNLKFITITYHDRITSFKGRWTFEKTYRLHHIIGSIRVHVQTVITRIIEGHNY